MVAMVLLRHIAAPVRTFNCAKSDDSFRQADGLRSNGDQQCSADSTDVSNVDGRGDGSPAAALASLVQGLAHRSRMA